MNHDCQGLGCAVCAAIIFIKVFVGEPSASLPGSGLAVTAPEMLALPPDEPLSSGPVWFTELQTAEVRPTAGLPPGQQVMVMPQWPVQTNYGFTHPGVIG